MRNRLLTVVVGTASLAPASAGSQGLIADSLLMPIPASRLQVAGANALRESRTIIVPMVLLNLSIEGALRASAASVRGSSVVNSEYAVVGLEKSLAQELALGVQLDFVGRLRQSGLTVLDYDQIAADALVAALERLQPDTSYGAPIARNEDRKTTYVLITPSDTQAFAGDPRSRQLVFRDLAKARGATVIVPELWFHAPQLAKERALVLEGASTRVTVAQGMDLVAATVSFVTPSGAVGTINLREPLAEVSDDVGSLAQSSADSAVLGGLPGAGAARALAGMGLGRLAGARGAGRNRSLDGSYELTVNADAYMRGVLRGAASFLHAATTVLARD